MILSDTYSNFQGYSRIIEFYHQNKDKTSDNIELKLETWFEAPICSMLGAVIYLMQKKFNEIQIDPGVAEDILGRNGFLAFLGREKIADVQNTTISYQLLSATDHKYFNSYVMKELLSKPDLPRMSDLLKKKIAESIYEIFVNAQMHSDTEKIFTCGQFFPKKHYIEFMITDIGIGFKENVRRRFGVNLTSDQTIDWAMKNGHTTKRGVSGGIGLALLTEFIQKNNGRIQIISGNGYWEINNAVISRKIFQLPFPGTMVNIRVRTNDPAAYVLVSEKDISDDGIF
jgi:hypothetical protein